MGHLWNSRRPVAIGVSPAVPLGLDTALAEVWTRPSGNEPRGSHRRVDQSEICGEVQRSLDPQGTNRVVSQRSAVIGAEDVGAVVDSPADDVQISDVDGLKVHGDFAWLIVRARCHDNRIAFDTWGDVTELPTFGRTPHQDDAMRSGTSLRRCPARKRYSAQRTAHAVTESSFQVN